MVMYPGSAGSDVLKHHPLQMKKINKTMNTRLCKAQLNTGARMISIPCHLKPDTESRGRSFHGLDGY